MYEGLNKTGKGREGDQKKITNNVKSCQLIITSDLKNKIKIKQEIIWIHNT